MAQTEWTYIPNFGDKNAQVTVTNDEIANVKIVEVVYGPEEGKGKWTAIQTGGKYQMISWKHSVNEGGDVEAKYDVEDGLADLHESIQHKKEIIEKAAAVKGTKEVETLKETFDGLMNEWKTVHYYHTEAEDALFQAYQEAKTAAYDEARSDIIEAKAGIVAKAQAVLAEMDFANGKAKLDELMEEWKKSGFAGKEKDQELWDQFSKARNDFFNERKAHFATMSKENEKLKKALVARAKEATASVTNYKEVNVVMQNLMDEWKKLGSAGKAADEKLWNEFNEIRQAFFADRKGFIQEQNDKLQKSIKDKTALIEEATKALEAKDFSKAVGDQMKELQAKWKETGFAGKQNDALWNEFKGKLDEFWTAKKADGEQKHAKWLDGQKGAMAKKRDQINKFWNDVKETKAKAMNARSKEESAELMAQVSGLYEKIKELESQIGEIERKLKD